MALDRAALPRRAAHERHIIEQAGQRLGHRLGPIGVDQDAGLALAHGRRDAAAPARDDRHAARRGLGERDPETLDPLLHQPRDAEVDLRGVVQGGQVPVGDIGEETHPVGQAELPGLGGECLLLLAGTDDRIPEIGIA